MKLEQQQELMARLSIMQKLSLAEAMEILNVSESTIRRIFAKRRRRASPSAPTAASRRQRRYDALLL